MVLDDLFSRKKSCTPLVNEGGLLAERYQSFQAFLHHNHEALNQIAELETIAYDGRVFSMGETRRHCDDLLAATRALVETLTGMARGRHGELVSACNRIADQIAKKFEPEPQQKTDRLAIAFSELTPESVPYAGSKATNLAIAGNLLRLPVPDGFVITAHAFTLFLEETGLTKTIAGHLAAITPEMKPETAERCAAMRKMIREALVPEAIAAQIFQAYEALEKRQGKDVRIALRSSAVGEDTEASFAGQYLSRLNVTKTGILDAYKEVLASKYTPRAILYRMRYGLEDWETPMCVAGVVMVDAMAGGVLYTQDPFASEAGMSRISAVLGLGERLVAGEGAYDNFLVDRQTGEVVQRVPGRKDKRLDGLTGGGTVLRDVPEEEKELFAISEETASLLARYALVLESHFGCPQDVEWALDASGALFLLQARPLAVSETKADGRDLSALTANSRVLLTGGTMAARGTTCGVTVFATGRGLQDMPEDAILVAQTASPDYAAFAGKIKGIITDVGSTASHLASVAREFGIPAIFAAGNATTALRDGQPVTMVADTTTVYEGTIPELAAAMRPETKRHIFQSPAHRRLLSILEYIAPLTLTDTTGPSFTPAGCTTIHDIIRFSHETAMREMFRLTADGKGGATAAKLTANIPISLYCIDLGDGLRSGLTTCDVLTPDHFESIPMKAIWSGFAHPGITWSGTVQISLGGFLGMMAASATAEVGGGRLGENSYAVLSRDYLNLSAKFGYHYANVDAYCSTDAGRNHILLQFAGGVGTYAGRTLRIYFLTGVLGRLGYTVKVTGDLLEASYKGGDRKRMETVLDQTGRLLAVSRLLDMAIPNLKQAEKMTEAFFQGDYDFLNQGQNIQLPGFYTHVGQWTPGTVDGQAGCRQDGSKWGSTLSAGIANFMGRMVGANYQEFLDTVEAYYYFPIAIAKDSAVAGDAVLRVSAMAESGAVDQAAGLAFAIRNLGNYFVLRLNALEDNVILFEFVNNQRLTRASAAKPLETKKWYQLMVEIRGPEIRGYLDGELLIEYRSERPLTGFVGYWTKADSVSSFRPISVKSNDQVRQFCH